MKPHFLYLLYIIRHKWFVFLACRRRGITWRGVIHDWSKFLPSEWFAYVRYFYSPIKLEHRDAMRESAFLALGHYTIMSAAEVRDDFNRAWLLHQRRNPHHWQYWVLTEDSGATFPIKMPRRFVMEMLADWEGAGRAIVGKNANTLAWYSKNRNTINLHPETRAFVDNALLYVPPAIAADA